MLLDFSWVLLLLMPVIGLSLYGSLSAFPRKKKHLLYTAVFYLLFIVAAMFAGLSFTLPILSVLALALAYGLYSFLVCAGWGVPSYMARNILRIVTVLPIACGYFLGTIGALGFLFIIGPYFDPPQSVKMADNLYCEARTHSGGPSWGFISIDLVNRWPVTPFVQIKRQSMTFDEDPLHTMPVIKACRMLMAAHKT